MLGAVQSEMTGWVGPALLSQDSETERAGWCAFLRNQGVGEYDLGIAQLWDAKQAQLQADKHY